MHGLASVSWSDDACHSERLITIKNPSYLSTRVDGMQAELSTALKAGCRSYTAMLC